MYHNGLCILPCCKTPRTSCKNLKQIWKQILNNITKYGGHEGKGGIEAIDCKVRVSLLTFTSVDVISIYSPVIFVCDVSVYLHDSSIVTASIRIYQSGTMFCSNYTLFSTKLAKMARLVSMHGVCEHRLCMMMLALRKTQCGKILTNFELNKVYTCIQVVAIDIDKISVQS